MELFKIVATLGVEVDEKDKPRMFSEVTKAVTRALGEDFTVKEITVTHNGTGN